MDAEQVAAASAVRPSARQLTWQQTEFYAFLHFGMNTMTDREWGVGNESPGLFDPGDLDADQWIEAVAAAGMGAVILTAKHHDGFCLWPSAQTAQSVASSPWRGGRGDVVAEVAAAAVRRGLGFGVYLSPWDRTEASYGSGAAYDDFFVAQLEELLTKYGPLFCLWFDGACGEGPNGRRQSYDWDRYYAVIRQHQPQAVISVCGPDVRWCGNEAGDTRANEWSVVPASLLHAERTASLSQQNDEAAFARQVLRSDQTDLGSRAALRAAGEDLVWYPAEVNTSIRPGWFHHPAEDDAVRAPGELFDLYRRSVGGNATLLLNVPPDRRGLVAAPDVAALARLGELIRDFHGRDVTPAAQLGSSDEIGAATIAGSSVTLRWPTVVEVQSIVLAEDITYGQQLERVELRGVDAGGAAVGLGVVEAVGHRRIIDVDPVQLVELTVHYQAARGPFRCATPAVIATARSYPEVVDPGPATSVRGGPHLR